MNDIILCHAIMHSHRSHRSHWELRGGCAGSEGVGCAITLKDDFGMD